MGKTLVLGASVNPDAYSNVAVRRLKNANKAVVALGIKKGDIAGVKVDTELIRYENIHTVTLYLNPQRQKAYYDYIIALRPQRVIFNPGTENPEFYRLLRENGIAFEIACTLVLLATHQY